MLQSNHKPYSKLSWVFIAWVGFLLAILFGIIIYFAYSSTAENKPLKNIHISGSETLLPLITICAESYMSNHSDVDIVVKGGGSSNGISSLFSGVAELAMSSRALNAQEHKYAVAKGIAPEATVIAKDAMVIVVNPMNPIQSLQVEQINRLYSEKTNHWKKLEKNYNFPVLLVGRNEFSGNGAEFSRQIGVDHSSIKKMLRLASNKEVMEAVTKNPGAIGYADLSTAKEWQYKVKVLAIRTSSNQVIKPDAFSYSHNYPLMRELYLISLNERSRIIQSFVAHCTGDIGQQLIKHTGFISLTESSMSVD